MSDFTLHRRVRLCNTQGRIEAYEDLIPNIVESKLPHALLFDNKMYVLLERSSATYHQVIPHLLNYKPPINGAH